MLFKEVKIEGDSVQPRNSWRKGRLPKAGMPWRHLDKRRCLWQMRNKN